MGETPVEEVAAAPRRADRIGPHGGTRPACSRRCMGACLAVANGDARHVLVYRTVKMMGGSILPPTGAAPAAIPTPPRPTRSAAGAEGVEDVASVMGDMAPLLAYGAYSAANWVAMHAAAPHGPLRHHQGTARLARRQQPAQRRAQPAGRLPRADDDGRLPRARGRSPIPFGLLDCDVPDRRVDRGRRVAADYAPDCPSPPVRVEAIGGAYGARRLGPADPTTRRWRRSTPPPRCGARPTSRRRTSTSPSSTTGSRSSPSRGSRRSASAATGESGPFVEGGTRIALDGDAPVEHLRRPAVRRAHARLLGAARGVPATARRGGRAAGRTAAEVGRGRRGRRPDRRLHAAHPLRRSTRLEV